MAKFTRPGEQVYAAWHWSKKAALVVNWPDKDYPREMIEMGRLVELHVRMRNEKKDTVINVRDQDINDNFAVFDKNHRFQRIYLLTDRAVREAARRMFWDPRGRTYSLADVAVSTGGKQATRDYPRVIVQPIGTFTHITYLTEKQGDGVSNYIHEFGEVSKIRPILCLDATGRFWVAGGSYSCPTPGITD
jgi:hypothetical protein